MKTVLHKDALTLHPWKDHWVL